MNYKTCCDCGLSKPVNLFNVKRSAFQPYCRSCQSDRHKIWYRENQKSHSKKCTESAKIRKANFRRVVDAKKAVACADCHKEYPVICMDFDHVSGVKIANVSFLASGRNSESKLMAELEKCEVVCSNCHRIRTAKRGGWRIDYDNPILVPSVIASISDSESVSGS